MEGAQKVLHFGSVAVGCTAERQIRLYNPLMVCALCTWGQWEQDSGPQDSVFLKSAPCAEWAPFRIFGSKPHVTHVC